MITSELLAKIFPGTKKSLRDRFIPALNRYCAEYDINTRLHVAAFLATGGVETDYLRTTVEYASGADYEGRADLGNVRPGDGRRFRGRGFFQTTGRSNHRAVTKATFSKLGIDFELHPEKLAEIDIAVESACIFWRDNKLAKYADAGDFFAFSGVVNRGSPKKKALHFDKRNALYDLCLKHIPKDFTILPAAANLVSSVEQKPAPADSEPVVLTSGESGDDFLTNAFDKNITADDVKSIARSHAPSLLGKIVRPFAYLFALLEAGNVYAWLGVGLAIIFIGFELYIHRAKLFRLWEKLKAKFTS